MPGYGLGTNTPSVAATGSNIAGGGASGAFTWTKPRRKAIVFFHPDQTSTDRLYILCNASEASLTSWEAILKPGDYYVSPDGVLVDQIAVYSNEEQTYGTNFAVRGWA